MNKSIYKDAPEYCHKYFDLIENDDLLAELEQSKEFTLDTFKLVPLNLEDHRYAPNKWTIKDVFQHITDMERVFAYRAFRFSRLDDTELSGVEEDDYAKNADLSSTSLADIREEYIAVRNSSIWVFRNLKPEMLDFKGKANNQTFSTRTLGFAMVGHNLHHCNLVRERYLEL